MPTVIEVLLALAVIAGPMALLLGSTSPLLSSWFTIDGRDPWWLYAASNAASLVALLAYPFLIQPSSRCPRSGCCSPSGCWRSSGC